MTDDKDEQMTENDKLRRMTESEEWGVVRRIFTEKVMDLQSINNIDPEDSTAEQLKARRIALDYMMDFWREVTGRVQQQSHNLYNELQEDYMSSQMDKPERDYSQDADFIQRNG